MPAAKPIAQHLADGTYRSDRHAKRASIEVGGDGELKPPPTLQPSMRKLWRRVVNTLERGWLARCDAWLLAGLVEALHFQQEAAARLVQYGVVVKHPNGDVHKSPYWAVWRQSVETVRTLSAKLGLSPADRARLIALAGLPDDRVDAGALFSDMLTQLQQQAVSAEPVEAEEW